MLKYLSVSNITRVVRDLHFIVSAVIDYQIQHHHEYREFNTYLPASFASVRLKPVALLCRRDNTSVVSLTVKAPQKFL
jgi:hypothetical protein